MRYYSRKDKHGSVTSPESPSASSETSFYTRDRGPPGNPALMYKSHYVNDPTQKPGMLSPIQESPVVPSSPASEKSFTEFHTRPLNASSIYTDYPTVDLSDSSNLRMDPNRESVISESRMYLVSPSPYVMMPNNPSYLIPPPPTQSPTDETTVSVVERV